MWNVGYGIYSPCRHFDLSPIALSPLALSPLALSPLPLSPCRPKLILKKTYFSNTTL